MGLEFVTILFNSSSSAEEQRSPNVGGSDVGADGHRSARTARRRSQDGLDTLSVSRRRKAPARRNGVGEPRDDD